MSLRVCQAIQTVRTPELKAYVIYVKPPAPERLRESRRTASVATSYYANRPFQVKGTATVQRSGWM